MSRRYLAVPDEARAALEPLSPTYGDLLACGRTVAKVRCEVDLDALPEGVDYLGSDPADVWEYLPPAPEVWT